MQIGLGMMATAVAVLVGTGRSGTLDGFPWPMKVCGLGLSFTLLCGGLILVWLYTSRTAPQYLFLDRDTTPGWHYRADISSIERRHLRDGLSRRITPWWVYIKLLWVHVKRCWQKLQKYERCWEIPSPVERAKDPKISELHRTNRTGKELLVKRKRRKKARIKHKKCLAKYIDLLRGTSSIDTNREELFILHTVRTYKKQCVQTMADALRWTLIVAALILFIALAISICVVRPSVADKKTGMHLSDCQSRVLPFTRDLCK